MKQGETSKTDYYRNRYKMASVGDISRAWIAGMKASKGFKDTLNYRFKGGELDGWVVRNIIWLGSLLKNSKGKPPKNKDWDKTLKELLGK